MHGDRTREPDREAVAEAPTRSLEFAATTVGRKVAPELGATVAATPAAAAEETGLEQTTQVVRTARAAEPDLDATTLGAVPLPEVRPGESAGSRANATPAAAEPARAKSGAHGAARATLDRTQDKPVAWASELRSLLFGSRRTGRDTPTEDLGETDADTPAPPTGRPVLDGTQQRIGRFAVLRKLGEGGMGEVFSAYDEELDRRVAIKLVRDERAADTLGHTRLQREAQALARLSHPNVVQVYDVGTHEGQVFIAMEFVRGRTLAEWEATIDPETPAGLRRILDMYIRAGQGLAAAHRCDLVHRDFKPENVLVGDDGRPRVVDFGLAATEHREEGGEGKVEPSDGSLLSSDLTRTGSVMGTPAYMAPEQFLARPSDARTDQFSFCVALYGALYRTSPFGGDTFATRQASVCRGEIEPAPIGSRVPAWLRALLVRGMQTRPEDRHASMDALLAALADDPDEARRRRRRIAALVLALFAAGALVLWAGLAGLSAWQRHRHEALVAERLAAMEANVAALTAAGELADAERQFNAFVRLPEHRGTSAVSLAWRHRAEREAAMGRDAAATDAYAASYAVATGSDEQIASLEALARFFSRRQRLGELVRALAVLVRRSPQALEDPALAALWVESAIARRDLRAADKALAGDASREPLRRLVRALAPARETAHSVPSREHLLTSRNERVLVREGREIVRLNADVDLTERGRYPTTAHHFGILDRGAELPPLYVARDATRDENVVLELQPSGLVERGRWADAVLSTTHVADLDGDGDAELLVGTSPYSRHLLELELGPDGGFKVRSLAPSLDARRSDVWTLDSGDLDGDGGRELVVGLGAWRAYEVHVLRHDPLSGLLGTVARHKLGFVGAGVVGRRGAVPRIFAWKSNNDVSPRAFPPDTPLGAPSGLHVLRLVGDRLEVERSLPAPPATVLHGVQPRVGDLDGDGTDEFVINRREWDPLTESFTDGTMIFYDDGAGGVASLTLSDLFPLGLHDLDGDGDHELIVRDVRQRVWVVGAGDQALPVLGGAGVIAEPPADAGPAEDAWRQAEELAEMGLADEAVRALVDLHDGVAATRPLLAARALLRAGRLQSGLGRDGEAAELFRRAAVEDELAEEAGLAAVDGLLRRGERVQARALLDELLARPGLAEAAARSLGEARRALGDDDPRLELDFAAPLDRRWRIHQPLALMRDAPSSSLRVDKIGANTIASLPVSWTGGPTTIEIELDSRRVEWGEELRIGLAPPGQPAALWVAVGARGGRGDLWFDVRCGVGNKSVLFPDRLDGNGRDGPGQVVLRAVFDPASRTGSCSLRQPKEPEQYVRLQIPEDPGIGRDAELVLASASTINAAGWISADIRRLAVTGASLREDDDVLPLSDTRHLLVEGHLAEAIAVLDDPAALAQLDERTRVRSMFWRISALARTGRFEDAAAVLRGVLADPALKEAADGPLRLLARTMPDTTASLLRSAGPPGMHRTWMVDAWLPELNMRSDDVLALQVLRRVLVDLEQGDVPPERRAELYAARARVHALLRMPVRARRDYEAALGYLPPADPQVADAEVARARQVLEWSIALLSEMVAADDLPAARALLARMLAVPGDRATIHDFLYIRDDLAALRDSAALAPR